MKKKNLVFGGVLGNKRKNIKNYIFNKKISYLEEILGKTRKTGKNIFLRNA